MSDLTAKHCIHCESGMGALKIEQLKEYLKVVPEWFLMGNAIIREFKFKNFLESLEFINKVGKIAEKEGHHPDINIVYNRVKLTLFTHAAKGLTENDFIIASKIDQIK